MDPETGEFVHSALDNAIDNGYPENLVRDAMEVAEELYGYFDEFRQSGVTVEAIIPHVQSWQEKNRGKVN
jgi:hypothetical protein